MSGLQMVDRAEVLVVVDNLTDNLSSVPRNVETEWKRNFRLFSGKCFCRAAHGLSCLVTSRLL
jgi:7,8-dihydropterin-6-yl-methyl-4-(beta-D-ribofuranosyl)aminobenzene 5'-phosphate synthase